MLICIFDKHVSELIKVTISTVDDTIVETTQAVAYSYVYVRLSGNVWKLIANSLLTCQNVWFLIPLGFKITSLLAWFRYMQLHCKCKIYKEKYRMFAGDSQTLCNKRYKLDRY